MSPMSPNTYIREFENVSYEELITERKRLVSILETIEKELWEEAGVNDSSLALHNQQVTYYSMNLCLSMLSKLMSDRCKLEFGWRNPQDILDDIKKRDKDMQESKEVKTVRCIDVPPEGNFIKGNRYRYTAAIDAVGAYDEDCQAWYYDDHRFLWYFTKE